MTPHVRSRLSAYLDGELPPDERSAVDQHLRVCASCAHRLEGLAALDAAARALPVDAPPGYFEDLPARVRARLDALPRRAWRPPVWSWAVAAALLLAIVTPATLWHRESSTPSAAISGPAARATPEATLPPRQAPEQENAGNAPKVLGKAEGSALRVMRSPFRERAADAPAPAYPAEARRPAPSTDELDNIRERQRPPAPERPQADEARGAGLARPAEPRPEPQAPPAKDVAERKDAAKQEQATSPAETRGNAAATVLAPALAGGRAAVVQPCSTGLLARPAPRSLAEARVRRQAWSDCLRDLPEAPGADEARVRLVAAGVEVYRFSDDENDLRQVLADAAAYLARGDAVQPERVRALLEELGRRP